MVKTIFCSMILLVCSYSLKGQDTLAFFEYKKFDKQSLIEVYHYSKTNTTYAVSIKNRIIKILSFNYSTNQRNEYYYKMNKVVFVENPLLHYFFTDTSLIVNYLFDKEEENLIKVEFKFKLNNFDEEKKTFKEIEQGVIFLHSKLKDNTLLIVSKDKVNDNILVNYLDKNYNLKQFVFNHNKILAKSNLNKSQFKTYFTNFYFKLVEENSHSIFYHETSRKCYLNNDTLTFLVNNKKDAIYTLTLNCKTGEMHFIDIPIKNALCSHGHLKATNIDCKIIGDNILCVCLCDHGIRMSIYETATGVPIANYYLCDNTDSLNAKCTIADLDLKNKQYNNYSSLSKDFLRVNGMPHSFFQIAHLDSNHYVFSLGRFSIEGELESKILGLMLALATQYYVSTSNLPFSAYTINGINFSRSYLTFFNELNVSQSRVFGAAFNKKNWEISSIQVNDFLKFAIEHEYTFENHISTTTFRMDNNFCTLKYGKFNDKNCILIQSHK